MQLNAHNVKLHNDHCYPSSVFNKKSGARNVVLNISGKADENK